jgi:hypothetical protein
MATTPTPYGSTSPSDSAATPDLSADANALLDEAKSAAGKVVDEAKGQVENLTDRAKQELGAATDKAKSLASDQKELLAAQVTGVADAIGRAASDLEQSNGPTAQYARMIADNAEKLSATIRDKDVDQLLGIAQDFGRRQPIAFMGAAALLGFAASRFITASAKRRDDQTAAANASADYQEYPGQPATSVNSTNNTGSF